jgi:hypothetical protein
MKPRDWKKTYWEDAEGSNRVSIQEVLLRLEGEPTIQVEVDVLTGIRKEIPLERDRIETADLSKPIIIVKKDGDFQYILDGNHRLQRAIDEKRTHVLSRVWIGEIF